MLSKATFDNLVQGISNSLSEYNGFITVKDAYEKINQVIFNVNHPEASFNEIYNILNSTRRIPIVFLNFPSVGVNQVLNHFTQKAFAYFSTAMLNHNCDTGDTPPINNFRCNNNYQ